ncbi:MAG TPA: hypothetical protein VFQ38_00495 [Longimicrobiales bacterium]|nr:hypothetical protein [Longimicrobiales bacterium]
MAAVLLVLQSVLATPAAAQRIAPARLAEVSLRPRLGASVAPRTVLEEDRFSPGMMILSGLAGGVLGAFLGYYTFDRLRLGSGEDPGVPGFFIGAGLGIGVGVTWYALSH